MQILFIITDLSVEAGGVTSAVCGLAEALTARGHAITIVGLDLGGTAVRPAGVRVRVFAADSASKLAPSRALDTWLRENVGQFDVVHIHGVWQRPGHYAARWAYRKRVPYLVAPHGMLDNAALRLRRIWVKRLAWLLWDGRMCRRAAAIHCLNEAEHEVSPWIRALRYVVVGNGVPQAVLADMPRRGQWRQKHQDLLGRADRRVALFLSRIHPKKGLDRLLALWPGVLKEHPDTLLVVAGTGEAEYVQSLKEQCRALGIDQSVVWAGQLVGRAKYEALVDADVFVLPSHQEGFSMAITEAMAARCPVVITRRCNFDAVATAGAGLIADDMPEFVGAVGKVLGDAAGASAMGDRGQRLVREHYTWEAIAQKAEQAYAAVTPRRRAAAGDHD
jgi:glycosyltransferase involved in cell wall biosynthesis